MGLIKMPNSNKRFIDFVNYNEIYNSKWSSVRKIHTNINILASSKQTHVGKIKEYSKASYHQMVIAPHLNVNLDVS
jgi:hypothetical protein